MGERKESWGRAVRPRPKYQGKPGQGVGVAWKSWLKRERAHGRWKEGGEKDEKEGIGRIRITNK